MIKKQNLLGCSRKKIYDFFSTIGESSFRVNQVMKWVYKFHCSNFSEMTDLKLSLRNQLNDTFYIKGPKFLREEISFDGTVKWKVKIKDNFVETVYIPEKKRATLCISSQVGCVLKCGFCATGYYGFKGNLSVSEIVGQIWNASKIIKRKEKKEYCSITNIVFMGMGEPLLNIENVITALQIILDKCSFKFSKRRITISTSGVVPGLKMLRIRGIDVNLALSLHAPNNEIRSLIMPINKKYNIESVLLEVKKYIQNSTATHSGITIEYVMLKNVNDSIDNAKELVRLLKNIPNKINLIPWNYFAGSTYESSSLHSIQQFYQVLKKKKLVVTIRRNRGQDIQAACGQLAGKNK